MAAKPFSRNARLEEEIRKLLSELLLFEIKDPRLDGVTVSSIRLTADRSRCKVYFSVIGDAERERQAADGFAAAGSFLRRTMAQRMRLRAVPELSFFRDTSYEYGDRMERLFERLNRDSGDPGEPGDSGDADAMREGDDPPGNRLDGTDQGDAE